MDLDGYAGPLVGRKQRVLELHRAIRIIRLDAHQLRRRRRDAFGSLERALADVIFFVAVKRDEPAARAYGTPVLELLEVRVNELVRRLRRGECDGEDGGEYDGFQRGLLS